MIPRATAPRPRKRARGSQALASRNRFSLNTADSPRDAIPLAWLSQKIYEVDPLTCPKCRGIMRIISFIEDREVIKAILKHLGLWLVKLKPFPKAHPRR